MAAQHVESHGDRLGQVDDDQTHEGAAQREFGEHHEQWDGHDHRREQVDHEDAPADGLLPGEAESSARIGGEDAKRQGGQHGGDAHDCAVLDEIEETLAAFADGGEHVFVGLKTGDLLPGREEIGRVAE